MHFLTVIYTAYKSLAKWWWLFLGTSHFDMEGWQKYPPAVFPPGIKKKKFEKSHIFQFVMHSKDLYIYGKVMTHTLLQK